MFKHVKNERGVIYPISMMIMFIVLTFILYYVSSYESQISIYNSLEFVNVRATINLLTEINRN
ncbi:hypothetical protein MTP04_22170 [Lysinibacillus sp. PLM2]|nr:hypothetical protein MTP04_22170 [Lysinibacillus sp. PLM2]